MKKIFIISVIILILAIISILGYFYYDKNFRYGKPINLREVSASEGYHFENAIGEKTMAFWNYNGNFQVAIAEFNSRESAQKSFEAKSSAYSQNASLNNATFLRKKISHNSAFVLKLSDNSNLMGVQTNNKNIEATNNNRSQEETEKFIKWFVRYYAKQL